MRSRSGTAIEGKPVIEGRLGKIAPDEFRRGDLIANDYAINEVTHYELYVDRREKFYWDFFINTVRIEGVDKNSDENTILRVPASV